MLVTHIFISIQKSRGDRTLFTYQRQSQAASLHADTLNDLSSFHNYLVSRAVVGHFRTSASSLILRRAETPVVLWAGVVAPRARCS